MFNGVDTNDTAVSAVPKVIVSPIETSQSSSPRPSSSNTSPNSLNPTAMAFDPGQPVLRPDVDDFVPQDALSSSNSPADELAGTLGRLEMNNHIETNGHVVRSLDPNASEFVPAADFAPMMYTLPSLPLAPEDPFHTQYVEVDTSRERVWSSGSSSPIYPGEVPSRQQPYSHFQVQPPYYPPWAAQPQYYPPPPEFGQSWNENFIMNNFFAHGASPSNGYNEFGNGPPGYASNGYILASPGQGGYFHPAVPSRDYPPNGSIPPRYIHHGYDHAGPPSNGQRRQYGHHDQLAHHDQNGHQRQNGNRQNGNRQNGNHQKGNRQNGSHQNGNHQSGHHQNGNHQQNGRANPSPEQNEPNESVKSRKAREKRERKREKKAREAERSFAGPSSGPFSGKPPGPPPPPPPASSMSAAPVQTQW